MSLVLWLQLKVGQSEQGRGRGGRNGEAGLTYIQLCDPRVERVQHERDNTASSSGRLKEIEQERGEGRGGGQMKRVKKRQDETEEEVGSEGESEKREKEHPA